jgi:hypothetical protein
MPKAEASSEMTKRQSNGTDWLLIKETQGRSSASGGCMPKV